jgi:hypothetical protein
LYPVMELALVLRELLRRRVLLFIGVLVAAIAATLSVYRLDGTTLKPRSLQYSSASTAVLVDTPSSVLGNLSQSFESLNVRALVYANFMASPAVLNLIGQQAGIPGDQIYAAGPVDELEPRSVQEPTALKRNVEITGETEPYRLSFNSTPNLPTVDVYSQAPTTAQAIALANGAVAGLKEYVSNLEKVNKVPPRSRVAIRQLGPANGSVVDGGISKAVAGIVFVGVFLLWCVLVLCAARFYAGWTASAALVRGPSDHGSGGGQAEARGDDAGMAMQNRLAYPVESDSLEHALAMGHDGHAPASTRSTQ